jgi:tRNA (guanine-N7-)-methyltransferase
LRQGLADLLQDKLPALSLSLEEVSNSSCLFDFFKDPVREIWLEIGFGGGEHLAAQAEANPDIGFIGCEVFVNGLASLVRQIEEKKITNIRIWPEDARRLFPVLPSDFLSRVFLLFPDPWPKARHAERRFVNPENLDVVSRLLKKDGEFRVASDDWNYIQWSLEKLEQHPSFKSFDTDIKFPPVDWKQTRYEQKALDLGKTCSYLRYFIEK